jgi:hypothetical protein
MNRDHPSLSLDLEPKRRSVKTRFLQEVRELSRLRREVKDIRLNRNWRNRRGARIGLEVEDPRS